jgi:hypothetical protein
VGREGKAVLGPARFPLCFKVRPGPAGVCFSVEQSASGGRRCRARHNGEDGVGMGEGDDQG